MPYTEISSVISKNLLYKVINKAFFSINADLLINGSRIFEYDIQYHLTNSFKEILKNKKIAVVREEELIDITLRKYYLKSKSISLPIEIKTFIKKTESISIVSIKKDIEKLKNIKAKFKSKYENGILILAIKEEKLVKSKGENKRFAEYLTCSKDFSSIHPEFKWQRIRSYSLISSRATKTNVIPNQIRLFALYVS
jgi:hypothetical protein